MKKGKIVLGVVLGAILIYCGALTGFKGILISLAVGAVIGTIWCVIEYRLKNQNQTKTGGDTASADEEIKKYKELLDNGAITQEEYEELKKSILEKKR